MIAPRLALLMTLLCCSLASAEPVDPAAAQQLGQQLARALNAGDPAPMERRFDVARVAAKALEGAGTADQRESMIKGVLRGTPSARAWVARLKRDERARVRFLGFRPSPPRLVFRTLLSQGVTYRELFLEAEGGQLRIVDQRGLSDGRTFKALLLEAFQRVLARGADALPLAEAIGKATEDLQQRRYAACLAKIMALPAAQRDRDPLALRIRLRAAGNVSLEAYQEAVAAFRRAYPDSTALPFHEKQLALAKGDAELGLASLRRLRELLGHEDPYLGVERARLLALAKEFAQARAALSAALTLESGLDQHVLEARFDLELAAEDWPKLAQVANELTERYGVLWSDFSKDPDMTGFVKSAVYPKWLERQAELRAKAKSSKGSPQGGEAAGDPNARMKEVERALDRRQFAEALEQVQALKAALLQQSQSSPALLGWAHYFEFRARFGLEQWKEALALIDAKLAREYVITVKNRAFMYSVASECASRLNDAQRCRDLMAKCIEARLLENSPADARLAVENGCTLLSRCGGTSLAPSLVVALIEAALAQKSPAGIAAGAAEALARQSPAPAAEVTRCVKERLPAMVELARQTGPAGTKLVLQLYALQKASWYRKALSVFERSRLESCEELWVAAMTGKHKAIKKLLSAADPNFLNLARPQELTPLMTAAANGHDKVVRALLGSVKPSERNLSGQTALHLAVAKGHPKVVKLLLKAGCDPASKDAAGKTPRDLARGDKKLERLLR
ncbi:MAG TPA: hypothetical protein DEA08_37195 [Planctomycetes bacterium]|nr:hypothetical protein [Planctomycetota bacterium]